MKITILTEHQIGIPTIPGTQAPSFYIQTDSYHCLLVTGPLNRIRENAASCGINLEKTDRIVVTERCPGIIQDIQYFLLHNDCVTFYLPRQSYQNYFSSLLYKLKEYAKNDRYPAWLSHIRFTDHLCRVDEQSWLYSLTDASDLHLPPKQVLVIMDHSLCYLFVNADSSDAEIRAICLKIQDMAKRPVNYIFYRDLQQNCMGLNCSLSENIPLSIGKTLVM